MAEKYAKSEMYWQLLQRRNCQEVPSVGGVHDARQHFDRVDSKKAIIEQKLPPTFKQLTLAHKMLRQAEKNKKLKSVRSTMIKTAKVRSQKKSPLLQMHYSQAVPSLNGLCIPSWSEQYKDSTKGSSKVIHSPHSSIKKFPSVELNGNIDGVSHKDLFWSRERQPTNTQDEKLTTLVDPSCVTEGRLAPTDLQTTISGNESTVTGQNALIMKSAPPVIETESQMQPVESTHANGYDSIGERQTLSPGPPQSPRGYIDRSNISIPATTQSDVLNETLITVQTPSDYSYNKSMDVEYSATPQLSSAPSVISPRATLSLNQQNLVQTPNAIKPTTSGVNGSTETRKRPSRRSNELIKMPPPPVGTIIRSLPNSAVRINSNQTIYDQQPPNLQKNVAKWNPATMVHVPIQAKFPMKSEPKSNPTATIIATSLKRKNKQNYKVRKIEKPIPGTMTNIASSTPVNLPDITIERVNVVHEDNKSVTVTSLKKRSFSDCVNFLQRNNVTILKVPRNSQPFKGTQNPPNKALDKYMTVFQRNGIRVERVSHV